MDSTLELDSRESHRNGRPTTFEELKAASRAPCRRCGTSSATHTLSLTAAKMGQGRGGVVTQMHKIPVCEKCGVEIFSVVRRALKV